MSKKGKTYTLWLRWSDGTWTPTITASGRSPSVTARQLLEGFRGEQYGDPHWRGHTRILPVGKKP